MKERKPMRYKKVSTDNNIKAGMKKGAKQKPSMNEKNMKLPKGMR